MKNSCKVLTFGDTASPALDVPVHFSKITGIDSKNRCKYVEKRTFVRGRASRGVKIPILPIEGFEQLYGVSRDGRVIPKRRVTV